MPSEDASRTDFPPGVGKNALQDEELLSLR